MAVGPVLGRAGVIPPMQWKEMTGKVRAPPSPPRAEAPADDAPIFPPIKAEAFDAEGFIKTEFMSRFMRVPPLPRKKGTTVREDEPDQNRAYDTLDVIEILEDQQKYFAGSFDAGMSLLPEHFQVNIFPSSPRALCRAKLEKIADIVVQVKCIHLAPQQ